MDKKFSDQILKSRPQIPKTEVDENINPQISLQHLQSKISLYPKPQTPRKKEATSLLSAFTGFKNTKKLSFQLFSKFDQKKFVAKSFLNKCVSLTLKNAKSC